MSSIIQSKEWKDLNEMTVTELEEQLARSKRAVIGVGSSEQHGPHLPLGTDWWSALGFSREVARKMGALSVPNVPYGVSPYHAPWVGDVTLSVDTLVAVLTDIFKSLYRDGIREMVVIVGHEGNTVPVKLAVDEAQRKLPGMRFIIAECFRVVHNLFDIPLHHANVQELIQVLFYDPDYVCHTELCDNPSSTKVADFEHERYRRNDIYPVLQDFTEIAPSGYYGTIEQPSKERVAEILDKATDEVISFANEFFEHVKTGFANGAEENKEVVEKVQNLKKDAVFTL